MGIAIIGWGSLYWDPRGLDFDGEWREDGPLLPIEFTRVSSDGRLTLVIFPRALKVRTLWTVSHKPNLELAIENLREREGTNKKNIGYISLVDGKRNSTHKKIAYDIYKWASSKSLNAVIWTDLQSNIETKDAINHIKNLDRGKFIKAKDYIVNAPKQIDTQLRKRLMDEFGW